MLVAVINSKKNYIYFFLFYHFSPCTCASNFTWVFSKSPGISDLWA